MTDAADQIESQWCLIGSIQQLAGRHHPHFSSGTRVHCAPPAWGDGYESIVVIGRHRHSKRVVKLVIASAFVTDWRAKVVYSPAVLRLLNAHGTGWDGQAKIEAFIRSRLEAK